MEIRILVLVFLLFPVFFQIFMLLLHILLNFNTFDDIFVKCKWEMLE